MGPRLGARAKLGDRQAGIAEYCEAMKLWADQGHRTLGPIHRAYLAELAVEDENSDAAAQIEEALALAQQTGEHWTDALLHRIRGDILLKIHPGDPAPAEQAYLAAIAVAQE